MICWSGTLKGYFMFLREEKPDILCLQVRESNKVQPSIIRNHNSFNYRINSIMQIRILKWNFKSVVKKLLFQQQRAKQNACFNSFVSDNGCHNLCCDFRIIVFSKIIGAGMYVVIVRGKCLFVAIMAFITICYYVCS